MPTVNFETLEKLELETVPAGAYRRFALILGIIVSAATARADSPAGDKHLVLDPRIIASAAAARLVPGEVEKDTRNPLLRAERPWENCFNNLYANVQYDEKERLFQLWYQVVLADKDAMNKLTPPATSHLVGFLVCYATSKDGITWRRPNLGIFDYGGSTDNNIVTRDMSNAGVFRDDHDLDASRRYKMICDYGRADGIMLVRFSPDGLHWSSEQRPEGLPNVGDTHNNAFWDERQGKYVLITRRYLGERLVYRSDSPDFLHWSEPVLALRSSPEEGKRVQTYCMPAFPYAGGYLGWAMMYDVGPGRTVDCELAWSADSVYWQRVFPGRPFVPRGPQGSYDSACIYAQAGPPVRFDGKLLLYYGGSVTKHAGWKRSCLPCLARLRVDGFACYEPAEAGKEGFVVTQPLRATKGELRVNANAAGGAVRVAVLDTEGYSLDDCEPITGDVLDGVVRWRGGKSLAQLAGQTVRLRFELRAAKLYSFSGVERSTSAPNSQ
ncbi:MAG TPA: hypothetical protein VF278_24405 [Pirellulales bacterium]